MPSHTVQPGEHLSRIAAQYGFFDQRTIWDHPQNAALKALRDSPNVLNPGDVLFIPDKIAKTEGRPTGQTHVFQVPADKLLLRISVHDFDNQPIAGEACELEVEGQVYKISTDGSGAIQQEIPKTAEKGTLRVPGLGMELPLRIGYLNPADQESGWQARLVNLGYLAGMAPDSSEDDLDTAIEELQCDYKVQLTGTADDATQQKLKELHGC